MPRRPTLALAMACCALLAAGCERRGAPPATGAPERPAEAADYVIGAGDQLGIFVYRAPELSVDLPVRPDGRVSIPLAPDVVAAGRTPTELAKDIEARLRTFVRDPNVTVMVKGFQGPPNRQVRVIGEAAQPIAIPWREGMGTLDVLIATRGLTRFAAGNRAEIVRREPDGSTRTIRVRLNDLVRDGDISQDIPMRPGDTLIIPQSWF